ncbi:MAG: protein kinase [Planctomycetes bacterium]|nr:protein kinase [Planctomycetota bacterium]MBL7039884.1 protein kinase [Pirellulaceae bacterium]
MNQKELLHPEPEKLAAFGVGKLSPEEIADIENHLAECDSCCKTLEMVQDDTFVSLVRSAESETVNDKEAERQQPDPTPMEAATLPPSASATPFSPDGATARETDETLAEPALADHARYRVSELLGTGGMGAVYKAEHRLMGRTVAVKVITPHLVDNPSAVERFQREVQAAARLAHPNIVTAHDAEQAGNAHFLVMEYVEGTSLADETERQGRLSVAQACDYMRQAALGLQHAFECGMVHRDIKPHNLMLTPQGQVKILDFGLAQFASQTTTHGGLTQEGSIMGTPDYMAPEQARDARTADIRADIYSLGCTLYCLLTGQPPFPEGSLVEKVMAHTEKEPPPVEEFRDDVPAGVQEVLKKMTAKDPAARYQTPAEVAEALNPFAEGGTTPATAAAWDRSRIRRWMWTLTAVAAALLALFGSIIYIVTDKGQFEIRSDWDSVQVVVSKGGDQFEVIDLGSRSTVRRLPSGEYEISLKGDSNLTLDKKGFTLTRGEEVIATVIQKFEQQEEQRGVPPARDDATVSAPPTDKAPYSTTSSPEQEVLGKFIGTWRTNYRLTKAEWTPVEKTGAADLTCHSVLDGKYVQERRKHTDNTAGLRLYTYDTQERCYRTWWFSSTGQASEATGKWDSDTETLTWTSVDRGEQEVTTVANHHFVSDSTFQWDVISKDGKGTVLVRMEGDATRAALLGEVEEATATQESPELHADVRGQDASAPPPEMKALQKLVGTWNVEQTVKVPEEGRSEKLVVKRELALGGRFVHEMGGFDNKGKPNFVGMYTYDTNRRAYRYWLFVSEGVCIESTGTWNERSQTFNFTNRPDWGGTGVITLRFADETTFAVSIISRDPRGKTSYHLEAKSVRQK